MKKFGKRFTALLLTLCMGLGSSAMAYTPSEAQQKAEALKELTLFLGTEKGFELERTPNRMEALIMLIRMLGADQDALSKERSHPFKDAPTWEGASRYLGYAYEKGLTAGVSETQFDPSGTATAQMYLTFTLRALGYQDANGATVWNQWNTLGSKAGLLPDSVHQKDFKREDAVLVSYAALSAQMQGKSGNLVDTLITNDVFSDLSYATARVIAGETVNSNSSLMQIMGALYAREGFRMDSMKATPITKENLKFFLGIQALDFSEGLAVEPMMSTHAHSVCLVRVKDGVNVEQVQKDIKEQVNPRKWICVGVEPENVRVDHIGNLIILVMDNQISAQLIAKFRACDTSYKPAQPDENKMIRVGNTYMEAVDPVDETSVVRFANKLKSIRKDYLTDTNQVYYATIPDKTFYARGQVGSYLDHIAISKRLDSELENWQRISLSDLLHLEDYYLTDAHWKQETLLPIVERLGHRMGFSVKQSDFTTVNTDTFVGAYGKRIQNAQAEPLVRLTSPYTETSAVEHVQAPTGAATVYDLAKLKSQNPYDVFLSGATPLTVIKNPKATNDKELIIFRDSFGSNLTPLLLEPYAKVTMIDLRYMVSSLLPQFVKFGNADVLFLYSDRIVNNSLLLR